MSVKIIIISFIEKWNFSFDATLVIQINKTSIPPIITKNNKYEYQKFKLKNPIVKATAMV